MVCKQRKECNMCGTPFKMTRGCLLEKRCPACRLIGIQNNPGNPYYLRRWRILVKPEGSKFKTWCFYDQVEPLHMLYDMLTPREQTEDIMDEIIRRDNNEHIMAIFNDNFTPREVHITMQDVRGYTLGEIGKELGLSRARVGQILCGVHRRMKHPTISRPLKEFNDS